MTKFKICRSFGYSETECIMIEAETFEEAQEEAWEFALAVVNHWVEFVEEGDEDEYFLEDSLKDFCND